MLRNYEILGDAPEPVLDLYFRQCSVLVDGRDLALIAATLANGGVNPVSGQRAVAAEHVGPILSVMTTCGIYDLTGEWVYSVGMPAKSGVGGGIIAVLPGQLGIGVFSPRSTSAATACAASRSARPCRASSPSTSCSRLAPRRRRCAPATRWRRSAPSVAARPRRAGCSTSRAPRWRSSSCRATCASRRSSRCCARSSSRATRCASRCSTSSASATSTKPPRACSRRWSRAVPGATDGSC